MKAKKKPIDEKTPADLGVDVAPRLKVLKTAEPPAARPASRSDRVAELVDKLKNEAGVTLMATLLLAEHDNAALNDATAKALTAAQGARRRRPRAGRRHRTAKPAAEAAAKLDGVAKVLLADGADLAHRLAEPMAALIVPLAASYDALVAPATTDGQERHAARRGAARRDADLRDHRGRRARHVRAADLCRQRHPDGAVDGRQEGRSPCAPPPSRRRARAARRRSRRSRPPRTRRCRASSATSCRSPTGRN